jgi:hypothetical protein
MVINFIQLNNMKTKAYRIPGIILLSLIVHFQIQAQNIVNLNQASGNITVTTGYTDNIDDIWNINTGVSKPVLINYNVDIEDSYDYLTITAIDNAGVETQIASITGTYSGTVSTVVPSGKVRIELTSDGSNSYEDGYSGITISYSVDYGYTNVENSFISGNSIVNGNMGIGVIAPQNKLEVNGTVNIGSTSNRLTLTEWNPGAGFWIDIPVVPGTPAGIGSGGLGQNAWIAYTGNAGQWFRNSAAGDLCYRNSSGALLFGNSGAGNAAMAIKNNNIVIGTSTSNSNLQVFGKQMIGSGSQTVISGNSSFQIQQNVNIETSLYLWQNGVAKSVIGSKPNDSKLYITNDFNGGGLGTANHSIAMDINGNVGIGTTTPYSKLDVNGEISSTLNGGVSNLRMIGGNYAAMLRNDGSNTYLLLTNNNDINGGYNTLRPWYVNNSSGDNCFADGKFQIAHSTGNIIVAGKIGIGLSNAFAILAASPSDELLTVNGTIHAKEVKVDLTGSLADFVFTPTYKLMSLSEVEQFVKINKHLPEVPSAAEVSKNGMSMGEMENKLLQKVEELTLYMIDQQKTIDQQSAKIEELEKKLK